VPAQLGDGELGAGRLAVPAVGGHGLEGVRDEDDARLERDPVGGEAVGIAAAVVALVVMAHPARLARHVGGADDVAAEERVALHDGVLGVGELEAVARGVVAVLKAEPGQRARPVAGDGAPGRRPQVAETTTELSRGTRSGPPPHARPRRAR
jgi:hypothetical protein